jgi:hypothetical protein
MPKLKIDSQKFVGTEIRLAELSERSAVGKSLLPYSVFFFILRAEYDENCTDTIIGFAGLPLRDGLRFTTKPVQTKRHPAAAVVHEQCTTDARTNYVGSQSEQPKDTEFFDR